MIVHGIPTLRDLCHVYLNRCDFHFLRMHINKTNKFCLIIHNGHVPGMVSIESTVRNTHPSPFNDFKS